MRLLLVLGIIVFFFLTFSVDKSEGIVGGADVNISLVPFTAAIIVEAGEGQNAEDYIVCSGSFVNSLWVLTSFECVTSAGNTVSDGKTIKLDKLSVGFGHSRRNQVRKGWHMAVHKIVQNKDYPYAALLKLNRNVTFSNGTFVNYTNDEPYFLQPVEFAVLPPLPGEAVSVASWGAIHTDGFTLPTFLQGITGPLLNNSECKKEDGNVLCFGSGNNRTNGVYDSCMTDQGAALVNSRGQQVGFYMESLGSSGALCNGFGIYQRTDVLLQWINETTSDLTFTAPASALNSLSMLFLLISLLAYLFV